MSLIPIPISHQHTYMFYLDTGNRLSVLLPVTHQRFAYHSVLISCQRAWGVRDTVDGKTVFTLIGTILYAYTIRS